MSSKPRNARRFEKDAASFISVEPQLILERTKKKEFKPLNDKQRNYVGLIKSNTITFGTGSAGTGKTFVAAHIAAQQLANREVKRIIVTRPNIEVGKSLGFLPGEMEEKYEPYFRPVREALEDALGAGHVEYLLKSKAIEARPLAYMRGSTFRDAFVIFDEAQNATCGEMKMFLTRIGTYTRVVINGDSNQCDLKEASGLKDAVMRLRGVNNIAMCEFGIEDIVRSGIAKDILLRYESNAMPHFEETEDPYEGLNNYLNK